MKIGMGAKQIIEISIKVSESKTDNKNQFMNEMDDGNQRESEWEQNDKISI